MSSSLELSLERKVGQLLMPSFNDLDELEGIFRNTYIGNVILYTKNLETPEKVQHLCNCIQKLALEHTGMPCIISIDQEGGV